MKEWHSKVILLHYLHTQDGGAGSGNFGHKGRPGEVGGSAPTGLSSDYVKYENVADFNKEILKRTPDAIGDKEEVDKACRELYQRRFGMRISLAQMDDGADYYKEVSMQEYLASDWQQQCVTYPSYDEYKKFMLEQFPQDIAAPGSTLEGLQVYVGGASKYGYGRGKDARIKLDEKYHISEYIDNNPEIQYDNGTVYRGVSSGVGQIKELQKALETGKPITMMGPSSWTVDKWVANEFTKYTLNKAKNGGQPVIFIDEGDHPRRAMPLPWSSKGLMPQHEVLYSGTVDFQVKDIEEKDGVMYVRVSPVD